ncbi:uncharacterized protein ACJ7VT_019188 [Polymixia lowei]
MLSVAFLSVSSAGVLHINMLRAWIPVFLLLSEASSFMIHNTHHSLCLEDTTTTGLVLPKTCNLDSDLQQWIWLDRSILKSVGTSRCLSAQHRNPVRTVSCEGPEDGTNGLLWDCDGGKLISQNSSLTLTTDGMQLILSHKSKQSKWRSLDEGDICQEKLRSKRASSGSEDGEEKEVGPPAMTEEQRTFLLWYYRTEDSTTWTFVLLGLSFTCLLVGFLLLGMGTMANKNRKKIAKYKAAAALAHRPEAEELQVIPEVRDYTEASGLLEKPSPANGETERLKPGDIVLAWKDGNVSTLYSDPAAELEMLEKEEEAGDVEEKGEEVDSEA